MMMTALSVKLNSTTQAIKLKSAKVVKSRRSESAKKHNKLTVHSGSCCLLQTCHGFRSPGGLDSDNTIKADEKLSLFSEHSFTDIKV